MTDPDIDAKAGNIVDGLCTPVSRSASGVEIALLPCPFCGSQIEHVTSWAKSFDPPRLYHEWWHVDDNEEICPIRRRSKIIDATNESVERQVAVFKRWNTRSSPTPQIAAEPVAWRWCERPHDIWRVTDLKPSPKAGRLIEPLYASAPTPQIAEGVSHDEMAYAYFKNLEWRGVRKDRDDFVRAKWLELPDETTTGPCNIDCNCDHYFHGKNYYRELAAALFPQAQAGETTQES